MRIPVSAQQKLTEMLMESGMNASIVSPDIDIRALIDESKYPVISNMDYIDTDIDPFTYPFKYPLFIETKGRFSSLKKFYFSGDNLPKSDTYQ